MRLSPLSQVRSAITGKNRFRVTIRQIQVGTRRRLSSSVTPARISVSSHAITT
jgi:hypothetical protein